MLIKLNFKRSTVSNWMIILFIMTIFVTGGYSYFFQAPINTEHELNQYKLLIKKDLLAKSVEITIKNQLGTFNLKKNPNSESWSLFSPRELPSSKDILTTIFTTLGNIKIRKIYQASPLYISNFSLETPMVTITLKNEKDESMTLQQGLINSIDNSTYIMNSEQRTIYHVDAIQYPLESLRLADFIDSRIFAMEINEIKTLAIYRGGNQTPPQLFISRQKNQWVDKENKDFVSEHVEKFLEELVTMKSHVILDKSDETQEKQISTYLASPMYTVELENTTGETVSYIISPIINSLSSVKIGKKQNFIVQASNRKYPYIVNKNHLAIFSTKTKDLRPIPIKKLFY